MASAKSMAMTTQNQGGKPVVRFFLVGLGLGIGVWQRQQTSLSSGFQVLQFGQFMASSLGCFCGYRSTETAWRKNQRPIGLHAAR
jgi:hypothetical protein